MHPNLEGSHGNYEASSSQTQRGQHDDSKRAVGTAQANSKSNETVPTNKESEKAQQIEASGRWNEVVQAPPSQMQTESGSSGKKSWAGEVEEGNTEEEQEFNLR